LLEEALKKIRKVGVKCPAILIRFYSYIPSEAKIVLSMVLLFILGYPYRVNSQIICFGDMRYTNQHSILPVPLVDSFTRENCLIKNRHGELIWGEMQ
jgi:hypothetical protein